MKNGLGMGSRGDKKSLFESFWATPVLDAVKAILTHSGNYQSPIPVGNGTAASLLNFASEKMDL